MIYWYWLWNSGWKKERSLEIMLVSIHSHCHGCIWCVLSGVGSVGGFTSSLYLLTAVFLETISSGSISTSLSLVTFRVTDAWMLGSIARESGYVVIILALAVGNGSLLPIRVVLVFIWVVDDGTWLINTYLRGLDRCIGLVVIALMHCTSKTCVHSRLISTALKTVS